MPAGGRLVKRGSDVAGTPLVSVVVLVLDDPELALRCLDSMGAGSASVPVETLVVANGTSCDACRPLEARRDIVLLRCGANLGFAAGNNLAAAVARGRFLLFLNDDSRLEPGYIGRVLATASADATIGAVAGTILSVDGAVQEAGSVVWSDGSASHIGAGEADATAAFSFVRDIDYGSANGLLVRREAWDATGGFDERYFPAYSEDVDLCFSLRRLGYRVVYEPRARLVHAESQSSPEGYRAFLISRNRRMFADKWQKELTSHPQRPRDEDRRAVARAVRRTNGTRPGVLVVAGADRAARRSDPWKGAAELASEGWGVTLLLGGGASSSPAATPVSAEVRDRLIDLGVDLRRGGIAQLSAAVGNDFEAIVVPAGWRDDIPPLHRADGTIVPRVVDPATERATGRATGPATGQATEPAASLTVVGSVVRVARRTPAPAREPAREPDSHPGGRAGGDGGGRSPSREEPPGIAELESDQARRELEAANAAVVVWQEYAHTVEGYLHAKTAYIESLPAVRLKRWLLGLLAKSAQSDRDEP